jgi:glycosyltransferase involved in cell wall biosynthesis
MLKARRHVDDVLVVDDGSSDATTEIAKAAGAQVLRHETNKGKGAAVKSALNYAAANSFDALVFLDGDGQHDPDQIPQLLQPILDGTADIVIGYRDFKQMPRYRRVGRFVLDYTTAANKLTNDSQSGFRALNQNAIAALNANHLQANGFSSNRR